jgi:surface antigen
MDVALTSQNFQQLLNITNRRLGDLRTAADATTISKTATQSTKMPTAKATPCLGPDVVTSRCSLKPVTKQMIQKSLLFGQCTYKAFTKNESSNKYS